MGRRGVANRREARLDATFTRQLDALFTRQFLF